ncbi:hypothetical protein Cgig2_011580 [Carnegiea gigantea]|uniref:Uncharacterized protein n=1 Tax=Carnegiea gigantea TaxID=171969 RepID=A0A9Q1K7G8_9CARY|nr:hypothetical protein Cgig2_011580 [Carnegiea gigantea]
MSKKSKIRRMRLKKFNSRTPPKGLRQLIENLNDNQKELDGKVATDLIITNSHLLVEVMTKLEELFPSAHIPLKGVRKVAAESMSNALIRDTHKKSKSKTPVLLQDSYESKGFLMEIDVIRKHFVGSRDMLDITKAKVQVLNYDVEDVLTREFIVDSSCLHVVLCNLQSFL